MRRSCVRLIDDSRTPNGDLRCHCFSLQLHGQARFELDSRYFLILDWQLLPTRDPVPHALIMQRQIWSHTESLKLTKKQLFGQSITTTGGQSKALLLVRKSKTFAMAIPKRYQNILRHAKARCMIQVLLWSASLETFRSPQNRAQAAQRFWKYCQVPSSDPDFRSSRLHSGSHTAFLKFLSSSSRSAMHVLSIQWSDLNQHLQILSKQPTDGWVDEFGV